MSTYEKEHDMGDTVRINPAQETRDALLEANTSLWAINLRRHRGDDEFRARVQRMRQETAELIDSWDASTESSPRPADPSRP